ncbi:hypothetical protein LTR91_006948 [Friedmanniomyces endolithicus]|uniref:CREG-like beta-barrel domain-containing protein n=1 Tax=Friedmanniomyces endolithicus TaxID=329885 RepID=A0AAN6KRA9_9PEZI|nr:hypothetical protein LTR75_013672 [Friedmanniomyces endolithicus]KAK0924566.1 hypothetical protein LTR57_005790 [Friedmanniomyces endolithicus]KAK0994817.1 hypothetical protein LTS01_007065 [Friedmanniomyces endolithicus]KAK0996736.1 hypothetical protein LTR91_006948 [Friedmanniomyces endolithicus]KAK1038448.1 hypothetical protein LTS16_011935 [Friedmanniomyces endolithicus]
MKLLTTAALLAATASAKSLRAPPILLQEPIPNDPTQHNADHHIPTIRESTIMARRIMHLSSLGTLVTTFPHPTNPQSVLTSDNDADEVHAYENRPEEMAGSPIGLMEYYADCEPATGNPTLLAINIATPYRNYAAGSNISLQIRWWPTQNLEVDEDDDEDIPTPHTPAALPRFSLHGRLEPIPIKDLSVNLIPACFMRAHPDSLLWQPGNDIHTSEYMRFVVEHIYWFGGFGDRARIGWLPVEDWRSVTREEVEAMSLPGEKGWRERGVGSQGGLEKVQDDEEVEGEEETEETDGRWGGSRARDFRL